MSIVKLVSAMKTITPELLRRFRKQERARKHLKTLQAALAKTEIAELAFVPSAAAKLSGEFTIELKTRGITWQQKSGRCWLFAALNILRERIAEKCDLPKFELSANYLSFFDKLEKANNLLEMAIEHAAEPMNTRMMEYILGGFGDGGYWTMAADLIRKYGVVPAETMPETWQSLHTDKFVRLLRSLLRKDVVQLRKLVAAGQDPAPAKEAMLEEVFRMECVAFGEPPESFDFTWRGKDGVFHEDRDLDGTAFCKKYADSVLDDYVCVTDHPTHGKPLGFHYLFHVLGSMADSDVECLNLSQEELQELAIRQLRDGEPVWFGCDSGAYCDRKQGVWDPDSLDFDGLMGGIDFMMDKGDRLEAHDSYSTHAMLLVGVHFDAKGEPDRWKIENSWGEDVGKKGYFVCSEKYFREYVYEVVVHKKYFNKQQLKQLAKKPVRIQPWECDWA